jgi:protein-tyrosine phosphatase
VRVPARAAELAGADRIGAHAWGTELAFTLVTMTLHPRPKSLRDRVAASPAGALLRTIRRAPERMLHPLRRRAARRALRERDLPRSVVFICLGNICRSPYAAAAFARALPPSLRGIRSTSAGLIGPNRPSPPEAVAVALARGIDLREHRSRLLDGAVVLQSDLIVVMAEDQRDAACESYGLDPRHLLVLGDLDPCPIDTRTIRDPWKEGEGVFAESYARIDRCVEALARALEEAVRIPRPLPGPGAALKALAS